jgi:hypothetical protein
VAETIVAETLVAEEVLLSSNTANRCEDCPDVNFDPPYSSECLYFEVRSGRPVCIKEDGLQRELSGLLRSSRLGSLACPNLVAILETGAQLPGVYPVSE